MLGNLVILNINPLGDNGVMLSGIGQVIVVVAISLFIQIKKEDLERPSLKYRFYVGFLKTD
jgi:uncharacterized radical SAM superfamily protein